MNYPSICCGVVHYNTDYSYIFIDSQYVFILAEEKLAAGLFADATDVQLSITGYVDFYNVSFSTTLEFCDFFGIEPKGANRDLFNDFSEIFSGFIPKEKSPDKTPQERILIGARAEGNNPNAIYCYDVRRNGRKENGEPNSRSVENSNKAETLRPELYKKYCADMNLSFFFSVNPEDNLSDQEIIRKFADR